MSSMKAFCSFIVLMLVLQPIFAQDRIKVLEDSIHELKKRIEILEIHKNNYDQVIQIKDQSVEEAIQGHKNDVNAKAQRVESLLWIFLGICGSISLGAFLALLYQLYIGTKKTIDKEMANRVKELVSKFKLENIKELEQTKEVFKTQLQGLAEQNREDLEKAVYQKSIENQIERETKMLVVCQDKGGKRSLKDNFFSHLPFKAENIDYEIIENEDDVKSTKKYDLVIFDDHQFTKRETSPRDELFRKYLKEAEEDTLFIYYGTAHSDAKKNYSAIANAANSQLVLHARIMETLNYQIKRRNTKSSFF